MENLIGNKDIEIIYYNREYNDYLYKNCVINDLNSFISQLISTNKCIMLLEVQQRKESK